MTGLGTTGSGIREGDLQNMKRLSNDQITIELSRNGDSVIACLFEHPEGCRHYDKYQLSDLPNDLISLDDLERFGINLITEKPGSCLPTL